MSYARKGKRGKKAGKEGKRKLENISMRGSFDRPKFKVGADSSCLSKRPFPCHVIMAHDLGSGLPLLLFGVAGAIRRNLDHAYTASPRDGGA